MLAIDYEPTPFDAIAGALLGAALGSYLGSAYWRTRYHLTFRGRSFCPGCGQPVPWHLNVPVLAFLLLRGRSACCQSPLSRAYLVLETSGVAVGFVAGWFFALTGLLVYAAVVIVGSLAIKLAVDRSL